MVPWYKFFLDHMLVKIQDLGIKGSYKSIISVLDFSDCFKILYILTVNLLNEAVFSSSILWFS